MTGATALATLLLMLTLPLSPLAARQPRIVLLVAGGAGTRMGTAVPKQFLLLAGEPVLLRTLRRWADAAPEAARVVVLPATQRAHWAELLTRCSDVPDHRVVAGGASRLASVRAGLAALSELPDTALVAIHDGVRPLVPVSVIQQAFAVAADTGVGTVAAVPAKDSVRRVRPDGSSVAEDRQGLWLVQTPQCFLLGQLRHAYGALTDELDPLLTDDASVVNRAGYPVTLIEGATTNLKITTPNDLVVAAALLHAESLLREGSDQSVAGAAFQAG